MSGLFPRLGLDYGADFVLLWIVVMRTVHDFYCLYSSKQKIMKLS